MILTDFISPDFTMARSVNLERDMGVESSLRNYQVTGKAQQILSRLIAALNGEPVCAWSLIGPYGMGKSSFARFLLTLLGPETQQETEIAWKMLEKKDLHLTRQLYHLLGKHSLRTKGFFRIGVTSSFEPINRTLANGLRQSLMELKGSGGGFGKEMNQILAKAQEICSSLMPDASALLELFRRIRKISGTPVALVIDEFGKNLEYMGRFPAQGDLFILQALAESEGIFIWVCLHQAFEAYTSRLSIRQLQEWGKIQGRFEDVSFLETNSQMIDFICKTLVQKQGNPFLKKAVRNWAEYYFKESRKLGLPELKDLDIEKIEKFYPLHPLSAVILPELCVRFAQNDRTLFAFLCSGEPEALPAFLAGEKMDPASHRLATFGIERLYDYFLSSSTIALMSRPESHRWVEIHDIIEKSRNLDPFSLSVLKTIGLLNLISGPAGYRASDKLLSYAFLRPHSILGTEEQDFRKVIENNQAKGTLVYRKYADEFRLWEGTDFDIPAAVREYKALLATKSLDAVLKDSLPLSPLVASKHSYERGTLRHFERQWSGYSRLAEDAVNCLSKEADGLILYCFGKEPEPPVIPSQTSDGQPVVVCYAACEDQIRDLVLEAAATRAVLSAPELAHDGVARKEARFRARMAEERLQGDARAIFSPGNPDSAWYESGERRVLSSVRDLSRLLSDRCDRVYRECPVIRNELINRTCLSSAAARARRELMDAMILRESHEMLGFEGTGPEVAIYRTMLLAQRLHRQREGGEWRFFAPEQGHSYYPLWRALLDATTNGADAGVSITELFQLLMKSPFGLKEGPIPILLCFFLIVNSDELALYQQGVFVASLGPEVMEMMAKRPEHFKIRRFQQDKLRGQVFQLYVSLLKTQVSSDARQLRNQTLLGVVGPLVQFVKGLKPYALNTKSVGLHAQNVRRVLQLARDPLDLLFVDLPRAVDLAPLEDLNMASEDDLSLFRERFSSAVIELRQAYPRLIENIKQIVLHACGSVMDSGELRPQLKIRASSLLDRCVDVTMKPILTNLANFSGSDHDWLVSFATVVSQRPVDSWRDANLQSFAPLIRDFIGRFTALETLIARSEHYMPATERDREPRLLTLTRPDGTMFSSVLWIDKAHTRKANELLDNIINQTVADKNTLETFFLLLSEHLFPKDSNYNGEGNA